MCGAYTRGGALHLLPEPRGAQARQPGRRLVRPRHLEKPRPAIAHPRLFPEHGSDVGRGLEGDLDQAGFAGSEIAGAFVPSATLEGQSYTFDRIDK